jgi:site-specific DNA-cytosine methylase
MAFCRAPLLLDGLVGGFSCKDFSRANQNRKQVQGRALIQGGASPGKTADTMKGRP